MRRSGLTAMIAAAVTGAAVATPLPAAAAGMGEWPAWAYAMNPPGNAPAPAKTPEEVEKDALAIVAKFMHPADDGSLKHVPDSPAGFTLTQIRNLFDAPDWRPDRHPPMPAPVAHGREPGAFACGFCHMPAGQGRPENASLAGLPAAYIVQQAKEIRSGARTSSAPNMVPQVLMRATVRAATDDDLAVAADYFSSLAPQKWIRVVESETVPRTKFGGFMLIPADGGGTEPIGNRIIETPENLERTELRDPGSGFVAYVPPGSVQKGRALVSTGGEGKTTPCAVCHGPDLHGLGPVPPIAGRSPSYIGRQLYDFQHGTRAGLWSPLMAGVVSKLNEEDVVSIVAYLTSLSP